MMTAYLQAIGEFRCTAKAIYKVTEEGCRLARWDGPDGMRGSPNASSSNVAGVRSSDDHGDPNMAESNISYITTRAFFLLVTTPSQQYPISPGFRPSPLFSPS